MSSDFVRLCLRFAQMGSLVSAVACGHRQTDSNGPDPPDPATTDTQEPSETGGTAPTTTDYYHDDVCVVEPIAPTWDLAADPCATLDGKVFQLPCWRMGFAKGEIWTFTAGSIDQLPGRVHQRYTCVVNDGVALVTNSCIPSITLTFDIKTGDLTEHYETSTWKHQLVGEDLNENFASWFRSLAKDFESADTMGTSPCGH